MPTVCGSMARGRMMRLTRLDECGAPVAGACSTLVTKGFILVTGTPNYQDPEEISQTDANGDICVEDQGDPALRWIDLNIQFCRVDPDAVNIITGDPVVSDDDDTPSANTVGWRIDSDLTGTGNFALELWSGVPGQACVAGDPTFGYWLFPWVKQARWGEHTIQNQALTLDFTARTSGGSQWGVGPYNVRVSQATATIGQPQPLLTPVATTTHEHFEWTTLAPPADACGCQTLVIP